MPRFRHLPTGRIIEAETHEQANRFRASHRLEEIFDDPVPDGNIREVLAWVGDDDERRTRALAHELGNKNRPTLIDKLTE